MSETMEPAGEVAERGVVVEPSGEGNPPAQADTTADAATADDDADDAGAEQPRHKGGFQKRISELTAERRRAEREAEHWREMAMRGTPAQQPTQQAATPDALPADLARFVGAEPKPTDFAAGEFDPAYIRAVTKYDVKLEQAQAAYQQRAAQQQRQQGEFTRKVSSIVEEATRADPTIADAVTDPSFPMPPGVVQVLMECDKPAAVLAHLAKNPEEAAKIAGLSSATAVARALDRIEQRLASAPVARPTAAPPPPRTLRGGSAAVAPNLHSMSMEDYARHRSQ